MIGSKFSRHFFNQSEVKPKPIVARACTFSRALCRLRVITSSFDWFTGLSPSFLIGQSNYFGFGFTTLILKPLYACVLLRSLKLCDNGKRRKHNGSCDIRTTKNTCSRFHSAQRRVVRGNKELVNLCLCFVCLCLRHRYCFHLT